MEIEVVRCEDCRTPADFEVAAGSTNYFYREKRLCSRCHRKRKRVGAPPEKEKAKAVMGHASPSAPIKPQKRKVVLVDFSDYPEVLEAVLKASHDQVRTPEQQILYALKRITLGE